MAEFSAPVVSVERDGDVGIVTLNRAHRGNAVDAPLLTGLREALSELDAAGDVRAIVLTGAGRAFCTGMDLDELDGLMGVPDLIQWDADRRTSGPWAPLSTPVVGAVNGAAVTGGLEIALACDLLVGSEHARFADTHARVGIVPGWGLTVRLPLAVGLRASRAMSLTGDYVDAATALRLGLLQEVIPANRLLRRAVAIARAIAGNDPAAVATYRSIYDDVEAELVAEAYRREAQHMQHHLERTYQPGTARARREDVVQRGRAQTRKP